MGGSEIWWEEKGAYIIGVDHEEYDLSQLHAAAALSQGFSRYLAPATSPK